MYIVMRLRPVHLWYYPSLNELRLEKPIRQLRTSREGIRLFATGNCSHSFEITTDFQVHLQLLWFMFLGFRDKFCGLASVVTRQIRYLGSGNVTVRQQTRSTKEPFERFVWWVLSIFPGARLTSSS